MMTPRISQPGRTPSSRWVKAIFVAALLLAAGQSAGVSAQWTTNGSNINNTNPGNVGVGTPSPTNKLHILGAGGTEVDMRVNGRIHTGDASGTGGVWLDGGRTMFVGQYGTSVASGQAA